MLKGSYSSWCEITTLVFLPRLVQRVLPAQGWGDRDRKPRWPHSSQINRAETDGWHKPKHPESAPVPSPTWTAGKAAATDVSVCGRQEMGLSKTRNAWDFQCSGSVEILLNLCNRSHEIFSRIGQKGMYCICTLYWLRTAPRLFPSLNRDLLCLCALRV